MVNLTTLDILSKQQSQAEAQSGSLAQKVAKESAQPENMAIPEEFQGIIDNIRAENEQRLVQDRMNVFNNYIQQMACGGCIKHGSGGSIHIDPSKKGTFTAAASRHGMGVQAFASKVLANKENYSPAMVKKANFARNASKWHAQGGPLNSYGEPAEMMRQYSKGGYIEDGLRARGVTGFRVTSGYRGPNSKVGHAGKRSGHARYLSDGKSSGAIDIVPTDKSPEGWARLEQQLRRPEVEEFIRNEIGGTILAETDPATMRKTGATGPHYHIGLGVAGGGNFYGHNHSTVPRSASSRASGASMPLIPFSMPEPMMAMAPIQEESIQPEAPWWGSFLGTQQQAVPSAEPSPFGEDYSFLNLAWNPMTGTNEPSASQSTFPNLFTEGGPVNVYRRKGRMTRSKATPLKVGETLAGSRADTDQCAKFANDYVRSQGYMQNGDAWNSSGISTVYSGYDGLERPSAYDAAAVAAYNNAASDNVLNNFDSSNLDPERLYTVNMYFRGSPYQEEAFNNGTKGRTGTHTGYLQNQDGQWYVVHNIHGRVHIDPFSSIQGGGKGWGVTGIYAPRKDNLFNRGITKLGFANGGYLMPIHCYADGGSYNDDFMDYYGLSWVPADQIYSYDPYYKAIQEHNPNGTYAVNKEGMYVPASEMKQKWDEWQKFDKAIPDTKLRNGLLTYIDRHIQDTDTIGAHQRMLDVLNAGTRPPSFAFNPYTEGRAATLTPYVVTSHIRSKIPSSGLSALSLAVPDIYIRKGMDDYHTGQHMFDELGHWWQYNPDINNGHRLSENDNWSLLTGNSSDAEMDHSGKDSYGTPGAFEHSAHLGHDAILGSYVFNTTPEYYLEHIAKPSYWSQDMDSTWYEQNKNMYQDTIKSIPEAVRYSDLVSKSMSDYGRKQYNAYWNDPDFGAHRSLGAIHRYGL